MRPVPTDHFPSPSSLPPAELRYRRAEGGRYSLPSPAVVSCQGMLPNSHGQGLLPSSHEARGLSRASRLLARSIPRGGHNPGPFFTAAIFEEYIELRDRCHHTVTGAARALGLSASTVSGQGSMLSRYLRGGIAGLTRRGRGAVASDLSQQIELLGWFVPACQFFYLSAHRRQGALVGAFRRAAALPSFPIGWRRETRARFLARLNLPSPPECPASLREELATREREGKPIVPPRIERLVKSTPADIRRHCFEAPVEELARMNLSAIVGRLAGLEPGGNCRLTIELL